jgi:hypothetical protein
VAISTRWKAVAPAAVLVLALMGNAARADPCKGILDDFKKLVDNAGREVSSARVDLQQSTGTIPSDKGRVAMEAAICAASAGALGTFKAYRVVIVGCMDERDTSRADVLTTLDRSISQTRAWLDKACH